MLGNLLRVSNSAPRTFELCGELDIMTAPDLLGAMDPVVRDPGDITLDLKQLSFMDSSGIRAMLQIAASLAGRSLLLVDSQGMVKRMLELSVIDGRGGIRVSSNGDSPNGKPVASSNALPITERAGPRDGGPCPNCSMPRVIVPIEVAGRLISATLCGKCGAQIGSRISA